MDCSSNCEAKPPDEVIPQLATRRAHRLSEGDPYRRPTFPALHEVDDAGRAMPAPQGSLPSMHSFRHTVASRALLAGESVDEIAFLLGHRDANVTRAVYVRELADARRRTMRRSRMVAEFSDILKP
jgi:integrase